MSFLAYFESKKNIVFNLRFSIIPRICQSSVRCQSCHSLYINHDLGGTPGDSGNLSTSLSNVARLAAHPKLVWVFNANCDGTLIYNDPV
jgi:hypothetical protein